MIEPPLPPPRVCRPSRHRWVVVDERREPSILERIIGQGLSSIESFSRELAEDRFVVRYRCDDCKTEEVRVLRGSDAGVV